MLHSNGIAEYGDNYRLRYYFPFREVSFPKWSVLMASVLDRDVEASKALFAPMGSGRGSGAVQQGLKPATAWSA